MSKSQRGYKPETMRRLLFLLATASLALTAAPTLYRSPAMSKTQIVFQYADDLWIVPRAGGEAIRLTTGPGTESRPYFSPDGSMVAFTGSYDGNTDVFVVPAAGGVPKRLTFHPAPDLTDGWTPDGKRVLFIGTGSMHNRATRLYSVDLNGGFPQEVALPSVAQSSYAGDMSQMAYVPHDRADQYWKRYRGGRATPIWIAKMADSSITKIPRTDSNDHTPMWIGNKIYFLSDRNGPYTLFSYDVATKQVKQLIENQGLDIKAASAAGDAIVYEQFGTIMTYDLKSGKTAAVPIKLNGDLMGVRPRLEKVNRQVRDAAISPTGVRAVFEARGEIFTVPAEKGDVRNLSNSPSTSERSPAWSPDGKWIAYFSDASGEYQLVMKEQMGKGETRSIPLAPSFYYDPLWSPDSKKISYLERTGALWYVDIEKKTPVKVDTAAFYAAMGMFSPHWSPDSKWIAYSKQLPTRMGQIHAYNVESAQKTAITDGMSDARHPRFDKGGKHLFFTATTESGPTLFGLDMTSNNRPISRSVYVVTLSKDEKSPFAPESDEEKVADEKKADEKKPEVAKPADAAKKDDKKVEVKIDFANITHRIEPLPMPARNYVGLEAGKAGTLFVMEIPVVMAAMTGPGSTVVHKFDLAKRKADKFLEGASSIIISANGEKMLYSQRENGFIVSTAAPVKPGDGALKTDGMEMFVDPRAEWKQMYREVWRIERDWFYAPNYHGLDLAAIQKKYEPYVEAVGSRNDLNYLFGEMLGELSVGHLYISGGDNPDRPRDVRGGLLGADYKLENGRYRLARVYSGENWNPQAKAPLTQPGVNAAAGEYILAINGREVRDTDNIYQMLEGTAGKQVTLKIGPNADGSGSREVTVTPVDGENSLRTLAWIEDNRRKVGELSQGKLAYVHVPDTALNGQTYFNRYYYAQADKQGVIIDERWNRGGQAADYIIEVLRRPVWNYWHAREGMDSTTPGNVIQGPKVMIANEWSGSGGDLLPWLFKRAKLGPVVGKRTWGGLVGIGGYPSLMDGGSVTAPHFGFFSPDGKWEVENHGTDVDVEVDLDPKAWREGRDTQLEKAVELAMAELKKSPPPAPKKPAFPDYQTKKPVSGATRAAGAN